MIPPDRPEGGRRRRRIAFAVAAAALVLVAVGICLHPGFQAAIGSWSVSGIKDRLIALGPWAWAFSAFLMLLQAIVAPLPAFVITIANGFVFGWFWGGVLSLLSATFAAHICFEVARALGRPAMERWAGKSIIDGADRFFERHGVWAILVARLLPFVPFDPISYAAGLTSTGRLAFLGANLAGQLPATFVYSTIGSRLEDGNLPWQAVAVLALAAVAVSIVAWMRGKVTPSSGGPPA